MIILPYSKGGLNGQIVYSRSSMRESDLIWKVITPHLQVEPAQFCLVAYQQPFSIAPHCVHQSLVICGYVAGALPTRAFRVYQCRVLHTIEWRNEVQRAQL